MIDNDILIEPVTEFSSEIAAAIKNLTKQLGNNYKPLSDEDLKEIILSPTTTLLLASEKSTNQITGMLTLLVYRIPFTKKAMLEDVVVDENFRDRGIGTLLINKAIEIAKENKVSYVDLTSHPNREAANKFYQKLGFSKRETNVYRLLCHYEEV